MTRAPKSYLTAAVHKGCSGWHVFSGVSLGLVSIKLTYLLLYHKYLSTMKSMQNCFSSYIRIWNVSFFKVKTRCAMSARPMVWSCGYISSSGFSIFLFLFISIYKKRKWAFIFFFPRDSYDLHSLSVFVSSFHIARNNAKTMIKADASKLLAEWTNLKIKVREKSPVPQTCRQLLLLVLDYLVKAGV